MCADHGVTLLVHLPLAPEFRRGHGGLYDVLAAGGRRRRGSPSCWWAHVHRGARRIVLDSLPILVLQVRSA